MMVYFIVRGMLIVKTERIDFMAVALKEDYQRALNEQKKEVQELVMAGLEQIKENACNTLRVTKQVRDQSVPLQGLVGWF